MNREKDIISTPNTDISNDSPQERLARSATNYIGSLTSLFLHTIFFIAIFSLHWFDYTFDKILLILTTVVSLEAIYLSIFIQMTVNRQSRQIEEVSEDIDDIQENVEEIQEDAKELSEEIEEIKENVEDLSEEIEKDDKEDEAEHRADQEKIHGIERRLEELLTEIKTLKKG